MIHSSEELAKHAKIVFVLIVFFNQYIESVRFFLLANKRTRRIMNLVASD